MSSMPLLGIALGSIGGLVIIAGIVGVIVMRRRPQELDAARYTSKWKDIQKQCSKNTTWKLAVIDADKLLDDALKQLRIKGKSMGERLVSAQRRLSDNDGVWFGHKLRNKIVHEELPRLEKQDVQAALRGFRQALKDLGALQ